METFADRLTHLKNLFKYSDQKIAEMVTTNLRNAGHEQEIKRGAVHRWHHNQTKPATVEVQTALAEAFGQSVAWLMHGVDKATPQEGELAKLIGTLSTDHQRMIREMIQALRQTSNTKSGDQ